MTTAATVDYLPEIERVARALARHTEGGEPDIMALAFDLDIEPEAVRRHVSNLRRRVARPACLAPPPRREDTLARIRAAISTSPIVIPRYARRAAAGPASASAGRRSVPRP